MVVARRVEEPRAALGVLWATVPLVAPWRPRTHPRVDAGQAGWLVRHHGRDSLAPFAMREDKAWYVFPSVAPQSAQALIAYRVVGGVALVSGMAIGPAGVRDRALQSFVGWAHHRGWQVAVLGAAEDDLPILAGAGLRGVYHGVEA